MGIQDTAQGFAVGVLWESTQTKHGNIPLLPAAFDWELRELWEELLPIKAAAQKVGSALVPQSLCMKEGLHEESHKTNQTQAGMFPWTKSRIFQTEWMDLKGKI